MVENNSFHPLHSSNKLEHFETATDIQVARYSIVSLAD